MEKICYLTFQSGLEVYTKLCSDAFMTRHLSMSYFEYIH